MIHHASIPARTDTRQVFSVRAARRRLRGGERRRELHNDRGLSVWLLSGRSLDFGAPSYVRNAFPVRCNLPLFHSLAEDKPDNDCSRHTTVRDRNNPSPGETTQQWKSTMSPPEMFMMLRTSKIEVLVSAADSRGAVSVIAESCGPGAGRHHMATPDGRIEIFASVAQIVCPGWALSRGSWAPHTELGTLVQPRKGRGILALIAAFKAWREKMTDMAELSVMTDRELRDIGLTRSDLGRVFDSSLNMDLLRRAADCRRPPYRL